MRVNGGNGGGGTGSGATGAANGLEGCVCESACGHNGTLGRTGRVIVKLVLMLEDRVGWARKREPSGNRWSWWRKILVVG
jgi:hypothetical protein